VNLTESVPRITVAYPTYLAQIDFAIIGGEGEPASVGRVAGMNQIHHLRDDAYEPVVGQSNLAKQPTPSGGDTLAG
jgi:hypothetical protein